MNIRLYGPSIGHASNARVAAGIRQALAELGMLAGFVPIDAFDEEEQYPGVDADIGLFVGPYPLVGIVRHGGHERRLVLVQPNSSWLPEDLVRLVQCHGQPIVPSAWAKSVVESYFPGQQVGVWAHGIDDGFRPLRETADTLKWSFVKGQWTVAHLSSSTFERKGTRELCEAWMAARSELPPAAKLVLIVQRSVREMIGELLQGHPAESSVVYWPQLSGNVRQMADLYRSVHVICQPSRGEAFGLVPLEARACGTPVVMTGCTGHAEHVNQETGEPGVVIVPSGELGDIDDGPGARAPVVAVSDLANALVEAYEGWSRLQLMACAWAEDRGRRWSWAETTERWSKGV